MADQLIFDRLRSHCPHVYPGAAPQGYSEPCIVYNMIGLDPSRDLGDADDTAVMTYQIDVYSTRKTVATQMARAIRDDIKSWDDHQLQCMAYTNRADFIDQTTETKLYRVMQLFEMFGRDE